MTDNNSNECRVEEGKQYLSEVYKEGHLPYGILNKGATGCGGTTLALESHLDYIVFVPTIELIENKSEQYIGGKICKFNDIEYNVEIFKVYGPFKELEDGINLHIREARYAESPVKILATYDSAPKLLHFLGENFVINCNILVDEFHSFMIDYEIRHKAIEALISALSGHPKVTYMSATPLKPECGPFQLQDLLITNVIWPNIVKPNIALVQSKAPLLSVRAIIGYDLENKSVINTEIDGKPIFPEQYFFYINNVRFIKNIITGFLNSVRDQMCIVCTKSGDNRKTLGDLFDLVGSTRSLKRYNFLTKRAYYGCDIDSLRGLTIVVTNVTSKVTLLDVNTDIIQIAGRIRDEKNPFRNSLVHIYNEQPEDLTKDNMNKLVMEYLDKKSSKNINHENFRRHILFKHFLYNETYNSLIKAYNSAQIPIDELDLKTCFYPELTQHYIGGFTKNLKEFYNYKIEGNGEEVLPEHLRLFLKDYPIIEQTADIWGIGKLKSLGFKESRIRIALQKEIVFEESKRQVINMLEGKISVGGIYSREYLISIFRRYIVH